MNMERELDNFSYDDKPYDDPEIKKREKRERELATEYMVLPVPNDWKPIEQWKIHVMEDGRTWTGYSTREEAIQAALEKAKEDNPSVVTIFNEIGRYERMIKDPINVFEKSSFHKYDTSVWNRRIT